MEWSRALEAKVWRHPGAAGWHFVTLPKAAGQEIRGLFGGSTAWGSVRVEAKVGRTTWSTSIFPDRQSGSYLLPLKADVRRAEDIGEGDAVAFTLRIVR